MEPDTGVGQGLKVEQLLRLHNLTKDVAQLYRTQLRGYVDALAPLFRPRRVLGDHIEGSGKESIANADQNLAELRDQYLRIASRPFELRKEFPTPIESVSTQMQLYEWEYTQEVRTDRGVRKAITVISPLTWIVSYPSTYSFSMFRQVLAGQQERDPDSVRAVVLRSCIMALLFAKQPGLASVFEGLRYKVEVRKQPQLGDLPILTVSAPVSTLRPSDELLLVATGLSGTSVFHEVIDMEAARNLKDPIQDQFKRILAEHGELA